MFKIPKTENNIKKKESSSSIESIESINVKADKDLSINKDKIKKEKSKSIVCNNCGKKKKRKRTILLFECRCGNKFCNECLLPENHKCPINYKEIGKKELKKNNPKVDYEKIIHI